AERIKTSRFKKLKEINKKNNTNYSIEGLSEPEIRQLFDSIKAEFGRDCFGQGYLFRIIDSSEIANVENLSLDEKINGIKTKPSFVPYAKGDKEGNRWFLKTPYYFDWNEDNVKFLKKNSGKKGKGMPVVRNAKFYFKSGFCWSDIHTV